MGVRLTPADVEQSDSEALNSEEDSSSSSPSLSIILAYEIFLALRALKLLLVLVCTTFGTVVRSEV